MFQIEGQQQPLQSQQQQPVEIVELLSSGGDVGNTGNVIHNESPTTVVHQLQPQPQPIIYTDTLHPASSVPCYQQQHYVPASTAVTPVHMEPQICIDDPNRKISSDSFQSVEVQQPMVQDMPQIIDQQQLLQQQHQQTSIEIPQTPCEPQPLPPQVPQTVLQVDDDSKLQQPQPQQWTATVQVQQTSSVQPAAGLDQVVVDVAATNVQSNVIIDNITGYEYPDQNTQVMS